MAEAFPYGTEDVFVGDVTLRPAPNGSYFAFRGPEPHLNPLGFVHPVVRFTESYEWWVAFYLEHDRISDEEAVVTPLPVLMARDLEPPVAGWGRTLEEAAAHLVHPR